MFRTIPRELHNIYLLIMSVVFHNYQGRDWLREFTGVVALNAPLARRGKVKDRKEAATAIAWYLGQLINDPEALKVEELEDRARRKASSIKLADDDKPIEHLVEDANNINVLAFRLLIAFGVMEQVRDVFPVMQQSDEPLFTEEAWPNWWRWASEHFFTQSRDAQPTTTA